MLRLQCTSVSVSLSPLLLGNHSNISIHSCLFPELNYSLLHSEKFISCSCSWPKHRVPTTFIVNPRGYQILQWGFFIPDSCSVFSISRFHPALPRTTLKQLLSSLGFSLSYPTPPTLRDSALPTELSLEGRTWHLKWHREVTIGKGWIVIITNTLWGNPSLDIPSRSPSPWSAGKPHVLEAEGQVLIWEGYFLHPKEFLRASRQIWEVF